MEPAGAERHRQSPEGELRPGRVGYGAPVKCWEIIADNLSKAGWTWGCVSAINSNGMNYLDCRSAHRDDSKRFVVREDEKLTTAEKAWIATTDSVSLCAGIKADGTLPVGS
jgi:hypothetical protein